MATIEHKLLTGTDLHPPFAGSPISVTSFMDGQSGRPTYAAWYADQATTDVTAVIQAAIDAVYLAGGGTVILPKGTFLLASFSSGYYTLKPKSNVSIVGLGPASILKVADGLRTISQGITVLYDNDNYFENCLFDNFTVDFNGANNLDTWHNASSSINRMGGAAGMKNIWYDKIHFKNSAGAHFLYLSNGTAPSNATEKVFVIHNIFENCGTAIAGNGSTDHTSVYFDVDNGSVLDNIFSQPNLNDTVSTAMETHGSGVIVHGNKVHRYAKAGNLGGDVRDVSNVVFSDNVARDVITGVSLYTAGAYAFNDLTIANFTAKLREVAGKNSVGIEALTGQMVGSVNGTGLKIINPIITGPDTQTLTGYAHTGISLFRWNDVEITDPKIRHFAREGIYIEAETRQLKSIKIHGGQLLSCGIGADAAYKRSIGIVTGTTPGTNDIDSLMITDVQIDCAAITGSAASYGIDLGYGRIPYALVNQNIILNAAIFPIIKDADVGSGDILLIHGSGPDPWGTLRASFGSTWSDPSQGKFFRAVLAGYNGTTAVWLATFSATAIPTTGTHRTGDRAIRWPPAIGSPLAWSCTRGGTSGTWVAEANL